MARAREFDIGEAIEKSMALFWENGYDRTSLSDLTRAIGCKPPSFYFAFGSKEGLFRLVLDRYYETYLGCAELALREPTSRQVAEVMLATLATIYTQSGHARGCLAVKCAMSGSQAAAELSLRQSALRAARRDRLRDRLQLAIENGDLPPDADSDELAGFVLVIGWGLAIAAQSGASLADLQATIARAMRAWPT